MPPIAFSLPLQVCLTPPLLFRTLLWFLPLPFCLPSVCLRSISLSCAFLCVLFMFVYLALRYALWNFVHCSDDFCSLLFPHANPWNFMPQETSEPPDSAVRTTCTPMIPPTLTPEVPREPTLLLSLIPRPTSSFFSLARLRAPPEGKTSKPHCRPECLRSRPILNFHLLPPHLLSRVFAELVRNHIAIARP